MFRHLFKKTARIPGHEVAHYQFLRKLHLIRLNFRYRGFLRTLLGLMGYLFKKLKLPFFQSYLFNPAAEPENGLDTSGIHEQRDLDIPEEKRSSATRYEASSSFEFRYVLERLRINYPDYHFIDYGSGKGAVLAVAARYPFASVTGIELSTSLHETACRNIEILERQGEVKAASLASFNEDAGRYPLPDAPHIFYLYNPFAADIMQKVLARIRSDVTMRKSPSYLLYNNPMQHDTIAASGLFEKIAEPMGGAWHLYRMRPEH
ncbi:MAG: hypothetical protein EP348_04540 [Alphaproteobacteria bacterium]|nr:MAG: hypothetical protein EP348_04540 [Alphaproteobacteria bacterium]